MLSAENKQFPLIEFVSTGVVDTLKKLLTSPYWENQKLLSEVLWVFINFIAASTPEIHKFLTQSQIYLSLIEILNFKQDLEVYENVRLFHSKTNSKGYLVPM